MFVIKKIKKHNSKGDCTQITHAGEGTEKREHPHTL